MAENNSVTLARKPRADATRNRARLLEAAKAVFAERGESASLDEVARVAGVGAGTLYRHFPHRDALVEAVYRNEVEQLRLSATRLAETQPPVEALRQWLRVFVGYIATKHAMYDLLNAMADGPSALYSASLVAMEQALTLLIDGAKDELHLSLQPMDLLIPIASLAKSGGEGAADGLIDVLIAGMRK